MDVPLLIKGHGEDTGKPGSEHHPEQTGAELQPREYERLARLAEYGLLDNETDPVLDGITELAAFSCNTPMAKIAIVDEEKTVFRSTYGITQKSLPRDDSLSASIIHENTDLLVVPDARLDPRFAKKPFVLGEPFARFFAAATLWSKDHLPMGSLCVIDHVPRSMTPREKELLVRISQVAMESITAWHCRKSLEQLLNLEKKIYSRFLHTTSEIASEAPSFDTALHNLMLNLDPNLGWVSARVRNMQSGGTTGIINNPIFRKVDGLAQIWQRFDEIQNHPLGVSPQLEYIDGGIGSSYSHLVVPVKVKNRLVALLEFIYSDHHKGNPRIKDIFDIMASNLSIVAERELIELELHHRATHDPLTDTANRSIVMSAIQRCLYDADPIVPESAVVFLDIDGFKEINDNFGHETGDLLLVEISKRLRSIARDKDIVGRLSGDEFVMILRKLSGPDDLPMVLKRIWKSLSLPYSVGELELKVSSSIGCAPIAETEINPVEVLRRAEEAMYLVKNGGRNRYCIVDEDVIKGMHERRHLDNQVRHAVTEDRMMLVYQPIVDLQTRKTIGVESLLRLVDRDGSLMQAGEFMESLKRSRYMPMVDDWVISEVCRKFAGPGAPLLKIPGFRASVNVSPPIISTKGYGKRTLEEIQRAGLNPASLTIELIESDLLSCSVTILENLSILRKQGVHIAIDDFGTGYSNLEYLSRLPVDTVKIDKSFLRGIKTANQRLNGLLEAMIRLSITMGYNTVIEGVEDNVEAEHVKALGCHQAQGYLYGKPMPIEELVAHLHRESAG